MSDLNSKYNELINEVFKYFIFYIPKSILEIEQFKDLAKETVWTEKYMDKLTYIDEDFNFIIDDVMELTTLLQKSSTLKNNCFKLIEYKETLGEYSFNYLAESYLKQLEFYTFFSNQLSLYFEKNSPVKDSTTQALFNFQNLNFNNHLVEVEKITGLKAQNFNQHNFIQEVKKTTVFKRFIINLPLTEKYFRDFISHERNSEIESIILKEYPIIKGKRLRYIIEFLVEKRMLILVYGTQKELYKTLQKTFNNDIGKYSSIFGYKVYDTKNSDYSIVKNELEILLKDFI